MINQKLKEIINLFPKNDDYKICFRYSDLTRPAQIKIVKLLKEKSSIYRIRTTKITYREMDDALKLADPPVFMNYGNGFNNGQFPRYRELALSRIIYHLNRKSKPSQESIEAVIYSSGKQIIENLRRKYMPNYMERRADEQARELERTMALGPEGLREADESGLRELDARLDEILIEPITEPITERYSNITERYSNLGRLTEHTATGCTNEPSLGRIWGQEGEIIRPF